MFRYLIQLLPAGVRQALKYSLRSRARVGSAYDRWVTTIEPKLWQKARRSSAVKISILVPAYNTPEKYISPLIASLVAQTYEHWELIIADASSDILKSENIRRQALCDSRIIFLRLEENLGISGNTNAARAMATGQFIALLDHDDVLSPHALEEIALVIQTNPSVEIIYSDEDKLTDNGRRRILPFFKPGWSPDLLLGVNYITHFLVIKRGLWDLVGGLRPEFDGAQDYDLLLRATEKTVHIVHIPKVLYHWRLADGSTAKAVGEKDYADSAGRLALAEAVDRRGIRAEVVEIPERPTNYRLKFQLPTPPPLVSIIIPFRDKPELLKQCADSILGKSTYPNFELLLISNNSTEKRTFELLNELRRESRCRILEWNQPFNYSKINNFGASKAGGQYLILLNNDTEVITPEWVEELIGVASQKNVGAVGPLLLYPNSADGIQHAGVVLGMGSMAGHVFRGRQPSDWTDFGLPCWPRNYLAVTGACLAIRKETYLKVGGLDERFIITGSDVVLGITLHEAGFHNIYWPFTSLYHHESSSVGSYDNGIRGDYDLSLRYYQKYHHTGDPYFNPNFDLMCEAIAIREE